MAYIARPTVSPKWRGILAGWTRGGGPRADPAQLVPRMGCKGAVYPPLSTEYDLPVARCAVSVR